MKKLQKILWILVIGIHGLYAEDAIKVLSEKTFNEVINSNPVVVVRFTASWCGACKAMEPEYKKAAKNPTSGVIFTDVDVDKEEIDFFINPMKAITKYQTECDSGQIKSCFSVAYMYDMDACEKLKALN